jgi:hypothetical protein
MGLGATWSCSRIMATALAVALSRSVCWGAPQAQLQTTATASSQTGLT